MDLHIFLSQIILVQDHHKNDRNGSCKIDRDRRDAKMTKIISNKQDLPKRGILAIWWQLTVHKKKAFLLQSVKHFTM